MQNTIMESETPTIAIAQAIAEGSEAEVAQMFQRLRASKSLFNITHELNKMLSSSQHSTLASCALKRLGLEYAG